MSYPDKYDPFNAPDTVQKKASEPSRTIIISVTANGRSKTVTCDPLAIASLDDCFSDEAKAFLNAENKIVDIIVSLPEWCAFPDYKFFYE